MCFRRSLSRSAFAALRALITQAGHRPGGESWQDLGRQHLNCSSETPAARCNVDLSACMRRGFSRRVTFPPVWKHPRKLGLGKRQHHQRIHRYPNWRPYCNRVVDWNNKLAQIVRTKWCRNKETRRKKSDAARVLTRRVNFAFT